LGGGKNLDITRPDIPKCGEGLTRLGQRRRGKKETNRLRNSKKKLHKPGFGRSHGGTQDVRDFSPFQRKRGQQWGNKRSNRRETTTEIIRTKEMAGPYSSGLWSKNPEAGSKKSEKGK